MKKIIKLVLLFSLFLFVVYFGLLIRDIFRVKNFVAKITFNRQDRVKTIGIEGLCKEKNIEFDENKQLLGKNLNRLLSSREKYLNFQISFRGFTDYIIRDFPFLEASEKNELQFTSYQEKESDTDRFNELKREIKNFDNSFKFESIEDFSWNVLNPPGTTTKNPLNNVTIVHSNDLIKLCTLIGLIEKYTKKNSEVADSSALFNTILKIYILNIYMNKGMFLASSNNFALETLYVFYDNLVNNKYTADEMKNMLTTLKKALTLIPDYFDKVKIQYEQTKRFYNFAYSEFPCLAYTISILSEDPLPKLEQIYNLFKEGKYKEGSDFIANNQTLSLIFFSPDFNAFYNDRNDFIDLKSKLALMQAVLESKLGLKITAVDPYDNQPIRSFKNDDDKEVFYCLGHEGKDNKGTGSNITNCDTSFKKNIKEPAK